jgi:CheY-like chemotaxis protein
MPTLLIIDEDTFFTNSVGFFFSNEGFTTETCKDGKEAIELVQQKNYDVIICNTQLKHKSGYEIANAIKQDNKLKNTPLILVSPANNIVSISSNEENSYDAYFQKPINFNNLKDKIKELRNAREKQFH